MITVNGFDLNDYFDKILDIRRDILPPRILQTQEAAGRDGVYLAGVKRDARVVEVDVMMIDASYVSLRQRVEEVAGILDTDGTVPMTIADEPGRVRRVILSDDTNLEEVVYSGRTTLRFFMPDPWKESEEEHSKTITSPPVSFSRQSTAYLNGEPVLPDQPRYLEGKFGHSILVEEGTTNRLRTPEEPRQEEVRVTPGTVYTLQHDMGSVEVGHKHEEDLSAGQLENCRFHDGVLQLMKVGEDREESLNLATGTHNQTRYDGESVILGSAFAGPTELSHHEWPEWEGGGNDGVKVDGSAVVMNNFPHWEQTDNMKNYTATGWDARLTPSRVTQTANTVRLDSYLNESVALVKELPGRGGIRTVEYLYWLTTPPGNNYDPTEPIRAQFILVLDVPMPGDASRRVAFYPTIFQEADIDGRYPGYAWVRLVITRMPTSADNGNIDVYINGQYNRSLPASGSTLSPRFQFIMDNQMQGRLFLADVKYTPEQLHGTQPSYPFPLVGRRVTPEIDLSDLGEYRDGNVSAAWWGEEDLPAGAESYNHEVSLEVDVDDDPIAGWSGYQPVIGGKIPQLEEGQALTGVRVRFRANLQSYDSYLSPVLADIEADIEGYKREYYTSGTWVPQPIPLSGVVRASHAVLDYDATEASLFSRVNAEAALEVDGVIGEWVEVASGEEIPLITRDVDLSAAKLHIRFHLSGSGNITPHLYGVRVSVISAYHREGYRISAAMDLSSIGTAAGSQVERVEMVPEGTQVIYEAQLNDEEWREITADIIPQIQEGVNLDEVTLRTRQRLISDGNGDVSPSIQMAQWQIDQDMTGENGVIRLNPATERLVLTPRGIQRWQLEQREYPTSFHPQTRQAETLWFPADVALAGEEGTLSLWAYEDGIARLKYLLDTDGGTSRLSVYRSEVMEGYRVRVNNATAFDLPLPPAGRFNQIAVRWNGYQVDAFINGVLEGSTILETPVSFTDTTRLYIGSTRQGTRQWNERLDEFHLSAVARPDDYMTDPERLTRPEEVDFDTAYLLRFDSSLADESTIVLHQGTAPTLPWFEVEIKQDMGELKILHIETGRFLLIQGELKKGDTVTLGHPENPVIVNGHPRKPWLSLESDFFRLVKGNNTFEVTEGANAVAYWRERWK